MSVIPVCEEFVSAFGSRSMTELCESCKRLIELYGTNEFAVPWRCTCNATPNPVNRVKSVQHQLGLFGSGDYCRLGCCDFSEKFAKHECKNEKRS